MKSGIRRENRTFAELIAAAAAIGGKKGKLSESSLRRGLKVFFPTAVKVLCAFEIAGALGERKGRNFAFRADGTAVFGDKGGEREDYFPLAETDADFAKVGFKGYLAGTLLPAIKIGITYGSLSVVFLERKMSVGYERAREVYDLIAAAGLLGGDDEINPGRKLMRLTPSEYDALYERVTFRK